MKTDIGDTALAVFRFEKKKVILPVLMVSILLISVMYGLHLRDSQKLDERIADNSRSSMTNLTVVELENEYFPVESGINDEVSLREAQEKISNNADRSVSMKNWVFLAPVAVALVTDIDIYPLTPGSYLGNTYIGGDSQSILFPFKDGYVAAEEFVDARSEMFYMQREFENLEKRLNSTNTSYSEFQAEVRRIKSVEYSDSELRQSLFDDGLPEDMIVSSEELEDNFRQDNWKELQLIHFIPSAIATFILYYFLSGLAVVSYRRISRKLRMIVYSGSNP